ncbi:MAG: FtsW/RodA/SpoVE family cell cycle protein [Clostridia bacterium]|nr:FtsW/RodA/SpoVE family cell cycle protein [Clostridia bacterium]
MKPTGEIKYFFKETDWVLYLACIITSVFGAFMVYSATYNTIPEGSVIARECVSTIAGSVLGIIICFVISLFDYEVIMRLSPFISAVCLLFMISLFKFGQSPSNRSDAICWLYFNIAGFKISFQPSELLKTGFIISFTTHIDAVRDNINSLKNILFLGIHGIIPIGLVILTGDLGSALVFVVIFIGMMFLAGVHLRYFIAGAAAVTAAIPVLWIKFFSSFQKNRLLAVYYPSALTKETYEAVIYQQARGLKAIGSGMLTGQGYLKGALTQSGYVPVTESDMIITVIGEELGFIGCLAVLGILTFIVFRLAKDGRKSSNLSGYLLCSGAALMIAAQSVINIGMCLSLLPCIGITLPFISSGGTSNMCIYFAIGVAMSVYRRCSERNPVNFRVRNISTPFREI